MEPFLSTDSADGVTPTLAELVALRALAQRRRPARKGRFNVAGNAASSLRGRGMEYAESREYVAGDDVRHIDWRLTARSGRTHTKLFQAERERLSLIVADTSAALYFGTQVRFKSVQAARAGAVAAWSAVRDGDRVAALRGTTMEAPIPSASGQRGALRVLDALVRWYAAPPTDDHGLAVALENAGHLLRPGSRVLVLADPRSLSQIAPSRWTALSAHHEVTVLLLMDALELEPPASRLPFAAGGRRIEVDLSDELQRQAWRGEFLQPMQNAIESLPQRGVRAFSLPAHQASDDWLSLTPRMQADVA